MFHCAVLLLIVFVNLNEIYSAPADVDNSKTVAVYNEYKLEPNGDYNYKYKLSDGQAVDVEGKLIDVGGNPIYRVKGHYTFEGTDGKVYTTKYIADENGYKIDSEHVPAPATRRARYSYTPPTRLLPSVRPGTGRPGATYVPPFQPQLPRRPGTGRPGATYVPPFQPQLPGRPGTGRPGATYVPPFQLQLPGRPGTGRPGATYVPPFRPQLPGRHGTGRPGATYLPPFGPQLPGIPGTVPPVKPNTDDKINPKTVMGLFG